MSEKRRENNGIFGYLAVLQLWDVSRLDSLPGVLSVAIHRLFILIYIPREALRADLFFLHFWDLHFSSCCSFVSPQPGEQYLWSLFFIWGAGANRKISQPCSTLLSPASEVQAVNVIKTALRRPVAVSGMTWFICAHRAATAKGLVTVAAVSWRMCSHSILYCHPVECFIGHHHKDIFLTIYLLRLWERNRVVHWDQAHFARWSFTSFPRWENQRERDGLMPQSSNQLRAWVKSAAAANWFSQNLVLFADKILGTESVYLFRDRHK